MADMRKFVPYLGEQKTISTSTSSANVALVRAYDDNNQLMLVNKSASWAYFKWGSGSQTATVSDYPVLPNSKEIITIQSSLVQVDNVACILESGASASTAYVVPGRGT